jgi:hypothetical protein
MTQIELDKIADEFRKAEYLSDIVSKLQDYRSDFAPYLDELKINAPINLPPHSRDQSVNFLKIEERKGVLTVPFRKNWVNKQELTSNPTPTDFYNSIIFALDSTLNDLSENEN